MRQREQVGHRGRSTHNSTAQSNSPGRRAPHGTQQKHVRRGQRRRPTRRVPTYCDADAHNTWGTNSTNAQA
eukprot:4112192-Prymnesium_polylepis.1